MTPDLEVSERTDLFNNRFHSLENVLRIGDVEHVELGVDRHGGELPHLVAQGAGPESHKVPGNLTHHRRDDDPLGEDGDEDGED